MILIFETKLLRILRLTILDSGRNVGNIIVSIAVAVQNKIDGERAKVIVLTEKYRILHYNYSFQSISVQNNITEIEKLFRVQLTYSFTKCGCK